MQKFERLVQEDLNVGTAETWTTAPGGGELLSTQIGLHTFARGQQAYEATWSPGAIAAGSKASTTVTVPDATSGDLVMASFDSILASVLRIEANISATDTVQVVLHNPTFAAITPASGTVRVLVFPAPEPVTTATITGTVTVNGNPTDQASVDLTIDGSPAGTTTPNGSGVYTFTNVTPGSAIVLGTGTGVWLSYSGSNAGTLSAGQTLVLDIAMSAT